MYFDFGFKKVYRVFSGVFNFKEVLTYLSFCYLKLSAAPLNFQKYTGLAV
jgi:hypothetical protein